MFSSEASSSSSSIVNSGLDVGQSTNINNSITNESLNWATEWVGYIALCMFSMVLVIPTFGIVGLMIWEYFSDEAERKAERKKEIDEAMRQHFGGGNLNQKKKKKKKKRHLNLDSLQSPTTNGDGIENILKDDNEEIRIDDFNENSRLLNDNDDLFDSDDDFDDDDDDDDLGSETDDSLKDVDDIMKQADCLLHKRIRRRKLSKTDPNYNDDEDPANNFDEILT